MGGRLGGWGGDSHPVFPPHVASGRSVLSAAAAGAPAGVVSAFAEPSRWCAGAVLNVAGCAVCASAAPIIGVLQSVQRNVSRRERLTVIGPEKPVTCGCECQRTRLLGCL